MLEQLPGFRKQAKLGIFEAADDIKLNLQVSIGREKADVIVKACNTSLV